MTDSKKPKMQTVIGSSNIKAYGYDYETKSLWIDFLSETTYKYDNVPEYIVEQIDLAESKGSFISRNINYKFQCEQVKEKTNDS